MTRSSKTKVERALPAAKLAAPAVSPSLTEDLMGIVGAPLTDKRTKSVLTGAGLPIGTDNQAAVALGISYATDARAGGGHVIHHVGFHASGDTLYVGGSPPTVKFRGYKGTLPHGLAWGESKATVRKKLGKPTSVWEDGEEWVHETQKRRLLVNYARGKLLSLSWLVPRTTNH